MGCATGAGLVSGAARRAWSLTATVGVQRRDQSNNRTNDQVNM